MGKARRKVKTAANDGVPDQRAPGCNSPVGCLVGKDIEVSEYGSPGLVKVVCTGEDCPAAPWLHESCFEKWENLLTRLMTRGKGRAREWTPAYCKHNMWIKKGYELIMKECRCPRCTDLGKDHFLRKVDENDVIAETVGFKPTVSNKRPKEKNQGQASKPMKPVLAPGLAPYSSLFKNLPGVSGSQITTATRKTHITTDQKVCVVPSESKDKKGSRKGKSEKSVEESRSAASSLDLRPPALPEVQKTGAAESILVGSEQYDILKREKEGLLSFIKRLVGVFDAEGLSLTDPAISLDKTSVKLMTEISSSGGFAKWLTASDKSLVVRNGFIFLDKQAKSYRTDELKNVGEVISVNRNGTCGTMRCHGYQIYVEFDKSTRILPAGVAIIPKDLMTFTATLRVRDGSERKWKAKEMELLQRGDIMPSSSSHFTESSINVHQSSGIHYSRDRQKRAPLDESFVSSSPPDDFGDDSWDPAFDNYALDIAPTPGDEGRASRNETPSPDFEIANVPEKEDSCTDLSDSPLDGFSLILGRKRHGRNLIAKVEPLRPFVLPVTGSKPASVREDAEGGESSSTPGGSYYMESEKSSAAPSVAAAEANVDSLMKVAAERTPEKCSAAGADLDTDKTPVPLSPEEERRLLKERKRREMEEKIAALCSKKKAVAESPVKTNSLSAWLE